MVRAARSRIIAYSKERVKASLDAVRTQTRWDVAADPVRFDLDTITALPDRLRQAQRVFDRTGGLHASGLFDRHGELLCLREDVGRHNAVDKVVGALLLDGGLPRTEPLGLFVSGRASIEMVQKAWAGGFRALVAVSAPTSLAVEAARRANLTLVGFVRHDGYNVYSPT